MLSVFQKTQELSNALHILRREGARIGFVPTMGALHEGHAALVERSWKENDITVCSIYVNPTQFNNQNDFLRYPKTIEADTALLQQAGCDFLLAPSDIDMYPNGTPRTQFNFGTIENVMEGAFRPGHFTGVGIVVSKLLNIVQPHRAYFGLKDLQQYLIVRQLISDLSVHTEIIGCQTIREADGLAMSSRNRRLTTEQREVAICLQKALLAAQENLSKISFQEIDILVKNIIAEHGKGLVTLEYFEIAHGITLEALTKYEANIPTALCIAAFLGEVRLIDNILIDKA